MAIGDGRLELVERLPALLGPLRLAGTLRLFRPD